MMVQCCVHSKFFLCGREKEHEGEDLYVTFVPEPTVGNVLRVAPTTCFLRLTPARCTVGNQRIAATGEITQNISIFFSRIIVYLLSVRRTNVRGVRCTVMVSVLLRVNVSQ